MRDNWDVAISRQTKRQRQRPAYVSLNKRGEIAMNDRAFKLIRCPYNVTLLYLPPAEEDGPGQGGTAAASGHRTSVTGRRARGTCAPPDWIETCGEIPAGARPTADMVVTSQWGGTS